MDKQIKRKAFATFTLICLAGLWFILSLTSCKQQPGRESVISVAYIENASCWPFFVAMEKELFDKAGLSVNAIKAKDSTEAINALLANQVDISVENTYSVIFAVEAQSPGTFKLLVPCAETETKYVSHLLVLKDSSIKSPKELIGKRIGTYTGATQLLTLKLFLKSYLDLDTDKDITIVQVGPSLQVQALVANQFDALFTVEPFASAAIAKGIVTDILPFARGYILNPFPAGACSVRSQVLQKKRIQVRLFYETMIRAKEFIDRNPAEARSILAKWTNLDSKSTADVKGYEYFTFEEFNENKKSQAQELADLYTEADILPHKINTKDMFVDRAELY
jgi:ABC-type nitrate/sulfonate/bicarbonate transport system substrate-binding protein